ncbi:hypothetical protein QFC19_004103 [Naganishia cerealis]|uniref:Uncharacterized protein n=1 Tax=Naganishia cerealis TaxID=610337 RepID=A0ACC2VYH7_9TREE|nr:hypothetical protein QFC19_004103 [Naganishia cerealis]
MPELGCVPKGFLAFSPTPGVVPPAATTSPSQPDSTEVEPSETPPIRVPNVNKVITSQDIPPASVEVPPLLATSEGLSLSKTIGPGVTSIPSHTATPEAPAESLTHSPKSPAASLTPADDYPTYAPAVAPLSISAPHYVVYADELFTKMPTAKELGGFNRVLLAFWMAKTPGDMKPGSFDNAKFWASLPKETRLAVKAEYRAKKIALMVSAFGGTGTFTSTVS